MPDEQSPPYRVELGYNPFQDKYNWTLLALVPLEMPAYLIHSEFVATEYAYERVDGGSVEGRGSALYAARKARDAHVGAVEAETQVEVLDLQETGGYI